MVKLLNSSDTSFSALTACASSKPQKPPSQLALPNRSFKAPDPNETLWVCSLIYIIFEANRLHITAGSSICSQSKWHHAMLGKSPSDLSVNSCTFRITPNTTDLHIPVRSSLSWMVWYHTSAPWITIPASCAAACWSTDVEGQCHRLLRVNWNKNFSPSVYWWDPHWEFFHHLLETCHLLHKI